MFRRASGSTPRKNSSRAASGEGCASAFFRGVEPEAAQNSPAARRADGSEARVVK